MDPRTIAITGAGSGMGAALTARLTAAGDRVIGIDVKNAEVEADLGTADGREAAIERVGELSGGVLDGLVTCAGLNGLPSRPASRLISVNYFGTVEMLAGLRPLLAAGSEPAAVAISSNSTTCAPGIDESLVAACLAGDEDAAKAQAGEGESVSTYPVTKTALGVVGAPPGRHRRVGGLRHHPQRGRTRRGAHPAAAGGTRRPDHRAAHHCIPGADRSQRPARGDRGVAPVPAGSRRPVLLRFDPVL